MLNTTFNETIKPNLLDTEPIRKNFPILEKVTYLNVGTYGIMPEPALAQFQAVQADFERGGQAAEGGFYRKVNETRQQLANLIHAAPEEIAFTRNATDGINLALAGLDWQPGDEVITTSEEHEAVQHPLLYLQKMKGIQFKTIQVSAIPEIMLSQLEQACSPRTRLLALSYITCETGTRLPAEAISRWAAEHNVLFLLDGAQASGALPVDVGALGCDFYASNGHKWLGGPKGTGFFYGKREKLNQLYLAHVGAGSLERANLANRTCESFTTGQRFEFGTRAWPIYAGLGYTLDWATALGWQNIYAHIAALSEYLKASIVQRPYLHLLTPRAYEQSSGLVSFTIEGYNAGEVGHTLREKYRIINRVIPHFNALRISTQYFNNPQDVDRLMEAIEQIVNEARPTP